mmetsp:Transcript_13269/g.24882  ORF Transcript_13269/g.24882 Transcript_13269/m.24882 type:complete len:678 (-) Transcript_13269:764-2797(-)
MKPRGVVELIIHLEGFRNIDLSRQGIYFLRLSIETCLTNQFAQPISLSSPVQSQAKSSHRTAHNLFPAFIQGSTNHFCSRGFLIRFSEEDIELNDLCVFRIELDSSEQTLHQSLILHVDLMFYDTPHGMLDGIMTTARSLDVKTDFKKLDSIDYQIRSATEGMHAYVPLTFHSSTFSLLNMTIHTFLANFVVAPSSLLNETILIGVACALFPSDDGGAKKFVGFNEAERVHNYYVSLLKLERSRHATFFEWISQQFAPSSLPIRESGLSDEPFIERLKSHDSITITFEILNDFSILNGEMQSMQQLTMELLMNLPTFVLSLLSANYYKDFKTKISESVISREVSLSECWLQREVTMETDNLKTAEKMRRDPYFRNFPSLQVEKVENPTQPALNPIIFADSYINTTVPEPMLPEQAFKGVHLFVIVHGYKGSSQDMRCIKNQLSVVHPESLFLCSSSNEHSTSNDIVEMGRKLYEEVFYYIDEWCPGYHLKKLSFIGHSLGGLIIRAALPHFEGFKSKMHLYLSLSSPHLGYYSTIPFITKAGLWVLSTFHLAKSIRQLTLKDKDDPRETAMYKLSQLPGLEWFTHVVLLCSHQDSYVAFDSARIQPNVSAHDSAEYVHREMSQNLVSGLHKMWRLDVNYHIEGKPLDSLVGRAAHIECIETGELMQMLMVTWPEWFS